MHLDQIVSRNGLKKATGYSLAAFAPNLDIRNPSPFSFPFYGMILCVDYRVHKVRPIPLAFGATKGFVLIFKSTFGMLALLTNNQLSFGFDHPPTIPRRHIRYDVQPQ